MKVNNLIFVDSTIVHNRIAIMSKLSSILQARLMMKSRSLESSNMVLMDSSAEAVVAREAAVPRSTTTSISSHAAITLTFGDCAENHVGMQIIGTLAEKGFTLDDLLNVSRHFPSEQVQLIPLHDNLPSRKRGRTSEVSEKVDGRGRSRSRDGNDDNADLDIPEAYVLILRNAFPNHQQLMEELMQLSWDTKALMRGRVVNKSARYNLCFDETSSEPNYEAGRGRIVDYTQCPQLSSLKHNVIEPIFPDAKELKVEGNLYYDVRQCGIGYHGDSERKKVIGVRLGAPFPLFYRWYRQSERVGEPIHIDLQPGDMYMMSEKATGCDWKKRKTYTLRHAAGCDKYTK